MEDAANVGAVAADVFGQVLQAGVFAGFEPGLPAVSLGDGLDQRPVVQWAMAFAMHQTRRQLFLASNYVAENPFHAECLKAIRKLREAPGGELTHSALLKRMKIKSKDFKDLMETLLQRGDVVGLPIQTAGRSGILYRLVETVKKGERS